MLHATDNTYTKNNITFIIKYDKFWDIAFHSKHNVLKFIGEHNLCGICRMFYYNDIKLKEKTNTH
jgi:hypothetical protein